MLVAVGGAILAAKLLLFSWYEYCGSVDQRYRRGQSIYSIREVGDCEENNMRGLDDLGSTDGPRHVSTIT